MQGLQRLRCKPEDAGRHQDHSWIRVGQAKIDVVGLCPGLGISWQKVHLESFLVAYSGKGGLRNTGESSRTAKVINDSLVASFKSCPRGGQVSSVLNVVSGIAHWEMNGDGRVLNGRDRIERATS